MTTIYRILTAIDYKEERKRNIFYTDNKEEAERKFNEARQEVRKFGEEKGLIIYDVTHNEGYRTIYADGTETYKRYSGARAELLCNDAKQDDFLDFCNDPRF